MDPMQISPGDRMFLHLSVNNGRSSVIQEVEVKMVSHDGKLALTTDMDTYFPAERIVETRFLAKQKCDVRSLHNIEVGDLVVHAATGKPPCSGIVTKVNDATVNIMMEDGTTRRGHMENVMVLVKAQK